MHHGVRNILLEHTLGLQERTEILFGSKKDNEPPPLPLMMGGEANDADTIVVCRHGVLR
jgi:hypothetical protein